MADRVVTYDVLAPYRAWGKHWDTVAAEMLGRLWLRWTVYRRTNDTAAGWDSFPTWERVSHHWTRRAAWRESSRLRFAEHTEEASRG
jgi:hypothetical protein